MKILVPIDEQESERAIPEALSLAGAGGQVVLASIGELPEVSEQADEARSALTRHLDDVARDVHADGVTVTKRIELAGDPVRGLVEIAHDEGVDSIVIASSHRGTFEQLVDGSVAEDLKGELDAIPVRIVSIG